MYAYTYNNYQASFNWESPGCHELQRSGQRTRLCAPGCIVCTDLDDRLAESLRLYSGVMERNGEFRKHS